jgi:hypothetical protein
MEVKNADLGFINNHNLGDSLLAIRGEASDVNRMFDINLPRSVEIFRAPGRIALTHLAAPPSGLVLPCGAPGDNSLRFLPRRA